MIIWGGKRKLPELRNATREIYKGLDAEWVSRQSENPKIPNRLVVSDNLTLTVTTSPLTPWQ